MIIFVMIIFLVILIIGKIFYIQVIDYKRLNNYANDLWSRNLPLEGNRGLIYDTKGRILASNITTTSLVLIPNQIKNKEYTAKILSDILEVSYDEMYKHVSKKTSIERVHPEGRRLTYDIADKISSYNIEGVYLLKESKRYYPYGKLLSHSLGFVGIDNQGLAGLELTYDKYLEGDYGAIKYYSDAKGNKLNLEEIYVEPNNGMNMTLTINYDIQSSLERELDNAMIRYNPEHALGIVMDPNSGEVLALSSRPDFDPMDYQSYDVEELNRNLPIWMTYEPGSTFKIITLATALEEKLVDLDNDVYFDSGAVKVSGATLHCWKHGGHGMQTYLEVVQNSCNPGFVSLGLKIGKDVLFDYIDKFGFGTKTGIDLNGESKGIIFDVDKIGDLELATTAFGQGVSVTPIQQVVAVSAAINGGILYKPYIVKSINDPETNSPIYMNNKTIVRKVISESTSEKVRYALEKVVSLGTGRNAYIDEYRVGGKTGTAQKVENGKYMVGNYITSFMGFLPADDPQAVIYIAIDNAKGVTQYGGTVAAPIAKNVMLDIINALDIKKRENGILKTYNYLDVKKYKVPSVIGLSTKEAIKLLKNFKVEFSGSGDIVTYQSPIDDYVKEGSIIKLMLN